MYVSFKTLDLATNSTVDIVDPELPSTKKHKLLYDFKQCFGEEFY